MQNVWIDRGTNPEDANLPGACLLDTMSEEQIIYSLERDATARKDLLLITTDPHLRSLVATVPYLSTAEETDVEQSQVNRSNEPNSIPFFAVFRGQPPFAQ
jgi:hypothetical protein